MICYSLQIKINNNNFADIALIIVVSVFLSVEGFCVEFCKIHGQPLEWMCLDACVVVLLCHAYLAINTFCDCCQDIHFKCINNIVHVLLFSLYS